MRGCLLATVGVRMENNGKLVQKGDWVDVIMIEGLKNKIRSHCYESIEDVGDECPLTLFFAWL